MGTFKVKRWTDLLYHFYSYIYIYISILQHDTLGSKNMRKAGAKNPTVGGKLGADFTEGYRVIQKDCEL